MNHISGEKNQVYMTKRISKFDEFKYKQVWILHVFHFTPHVKILNTYKKDTNKKHI